MRKHPQFGGTALKIAGILDDAKRAAIDAIEHEFAYGSQYCESPIEELFLAQLIHPEAAAEFQMRVEVIRPPTGLVAKAVAPPWQGYYVYPQIVIGEYRVDFYVVGVFAAGTSAVVVELDGHDFHEKTREQVARDKARDRYLVMQGYQLLRYSGSEVYRDPLAVAWQVMDYLREQAFRQP